MRHRPSWALAAGVLLGVIATQAAAQTAASGSSSATNPLSIEANNQTCLFDSDCPTNRFCLAPPRSRLRGRCLQCWRCCTFPGVYGSCPSKCACNQGAPCTLPSSCGQGMFCGTDSDPALPPVCQPCTRCMSDSQDISGACTASCPSGALSTAGLNDSSTPAAQQYVFLAFLAAEVAPTSASTVTSGMLNSSDIDGWLAWEGLGSSERLSMMAALNAGGSQTPLAVTSFISALESRDSTSLRCPPLPSDTSTPLPVVVYEGCACNATAAPATFRCPAGTRCSRTAFQGLSSDALEDPAAERLRAVCIACAPGQYCPEGTYVAQEDDLSVLDCPAGLYCPTPAAALECPAGSYCVDRTVEPISCNYTELLTTQPFTVMPMVGDMVIVRLRDDGDPIQGNYCPVNSTKPNTLCADGYYCPNVTAQIQCPQGYYCRQQSISPRKCNVLTRCPPGTAIPSYSSLAFVILVVVVASLPAVYYLLTLIDSSSTRYEDLDRFELKRNRAIKVTRQLLQAIKSRSMVGAAADMNAEMQAKYAGFGMIEPRVRLDFDQLGLTLPGKGKVLEGVSGYFPPGKMNAVMGPSGSGKTTFLNVLCGKAGGEVSGAVFVNGTRMMLASMRQITGFVPQDDIVHEDLSVRENLAYAAHLKLPRDLADAHRRGAVIDDALEMLQLKHIQHYRVGSVEKRGISGGQRKRVNIGLELVGSPSVLFLDEPTSGLDSTASNDILKSLSDMAALGMSIIAVIHQPRFSSFMLFDQVLLLGHGGQTVYMGPPGVAVLYFQRGLGFSFPPRENPADALMDIIGGKMAREGDARFKPSLLPEWWRLSGGAWVDEFERLNSGHKGDALEVDPEMIEQMEEEFDRVDEDCDGLISSEGLMEIFESLGHALSVDDAMLLMKKMTAAAAGGAHGSASEGATALKAGDSAVGGELLVTREQLVDLFQSMSERGRQTGRLDAMERYQSDQMTFRYPDLDVTSATGGPSSTAPSRMVSTTGGGPPRTHPPAPVSESVFTVSRGALQADRLHMSLPLRLATAAGPTSSPRSPLPRPAALTTSMGGGAVHDLSRGAPGGVSPVRQVPGMTGSPEGKQGVTRYEGDAAGGGGGIRDKRAWTLQMNYLVDAVADATSDMGHTAHASGHTRDHTGHTTAASPGRSTRRVLAPHGTAAGTAFGTPAHANSPQRGPVSAPQISMGPMPMSPVHASASMRRGHVQMIDNPLYPSRAQTPRGLGRGGPDVQPDVQPGTPRGGHPFVGHLVTPSSPHHVMSPHRAVTSMEQQRSLAHHLASPTAAALSPRSGPYPAGVSSNNGSGAGGTGVSAPPRSPHHLMIKIPSGGAPVYSPRGTAKTPGGRTGPGPIAEATEAVTPQGTAGGGGSVLPVSTSPRLITAPPTAAAPGSSTGVEVGERNTRYMDRLLRGVVAASAHSRSKLGERPVGAGALGPYRGQSSGGGALYHGPGHTSEGGSRGVTNSNNNSAWSWINRPFKFFTKLTGRGEQQQVHQGSRAAGGTSSLPVGALRSHSFDLFDRLSMRQAEAQEASRAAGLPDYSELGLMLKERSFPGFMPQVNLLLRRGLIKYLRSFWPLKVVDILLLLVASLIIGFIHGTHWGLSGVPSNAVMAMTCLGVLSMVTHLRTFSAQRLLLWREAASGIGMPALFLSANAIDLTWIFIAPAIYLGPYYYLTLPRLSFSEYYVVGLQVCWWASGMAYLVAAVLPPSTVLMSGVFVALILGAFVQGLTPTIATARGTFLEFLLGLSYNRWSMEILTISEYKHYQDNLRNVMIMIAKGIGLCGVDKLLYDDGQSGISPKEAISFLNVQQNFTFESCSSYITDAHIALLCLGIGTRLLAYLCLRYSPKKQY